MDKILSSRVKQKVDTEANWVAKNPVPLDGELIFVKTSGGDIQMKIGDGTTSYNDLSFLNFGFVADETANGFTYE